MRVTGRQSPTRTHQSQIINHKSLIAGVLLSAALLLAYVPDLGHGFVKDDFGWIRGARIESANLLPGDTSEPVTRLVRGVKIAATPGRYPRRAGIPNKEPLGRDGR